MRALKKRFLYFSFTISISAAVSFSSHAQTAAGYGFRTMVDKTRILIGEPFTLTFVTSSGVGEAIPSPPALPGSGHHFELLEGLPPDTLRKEDILEVSYRYRMTSFDSGHWVIPSFRVSIAGSKRVSISDTIWMDVSMPPLTGNDYHDIKDIVEVQPESSRWGRHLIFFSVILLVAVIAGFILYLKKKQLESPRSASGHDPFGQAMHDIDLLLRDLETGDKDAGKVHMALHELFRSYLEKSYGMPAMSASTTDLLIMLRELVDRPEIAGHFSPKGVHPDRRSVDVISAVAVLPEVNDLSAVAETLRIADAVKFARYRPGKEDTLRSIDRVRSFIVRVHEKRQ
jgi:hypothetical protein